MIALCAALLALAEATPAAPAASLAPAGEPPAPSSFSMPYAQLTLSPQIAERRLTYRDRVTPGLAGYQSGAVGLLQLAGEIFPSNGKGLPIVSDVGLTGSASRSLRGDAKFGAGEDYEDLWHAWEVGARWRGIFAGEEWLSISIQYGSLSSQLSGPKLYGVLLPTGTQQYWRPGLNLRLPLGQFAISIYGGYLDVVVQDAIGHAFPRNGEGGVDLGAKLAFTFGNPLVLNTHLELHAAARYLRFFYTLNPEPNDPFVAGGALDEYAIFELGLGLRG